MYMIKLSADNRVLSAVDEQFAPESHVVFPEGTTVWDEPTEYTVVDGLPDDCVMVEDLPEGDIHDYLYIDGEYIYDPLPVPEQPEPETPDTGDSVWDELDAAYQEGYNEGYTEGVNSAYDNQ